MFQVFLIIFWATIRLQNRGEAVCDPSVGAADSSPQGEPMAVACGAVLFASPAKGRWGRRAAHGSVGSRFFDVSSNPSGSQANHLPLTGEAMTVSLDRGGNDKELLPPCFGGEEDEHGENFEAAEEHVEAQDCLTYYIKPGNTHGEGVRVDAVADVAEA